MIIESACAPPFLKNGFVVSCERTREAIYIDPGDEVPELLDYIARDEATFFARAKRHLVLFERAGNTDGLVGPGVAAWPRLQLDKLTFGGVTLSRDGTVRALPETSPTVLAQVATRFRLE